MGEILSGYGYQFLILVNIFCERSVRPNGSFEKAGGRRGHCEIKAVSFVKCHKSLITLSM